MLGRFAQSYLCITMDGEMLEKVAQALQIAHLVITDHNTASDKNQYPEIHRLATHKYPGDPRPAPSVTLRPAVGLWRPIKSLLSMIVTMLPSTPSTPRVSHIVYLHYSCG